MKGVRKKKTCNSSNYSNYWHQFWELKSISINSQSYISLFYFNHSLIDFLGINLFCCYIIVSIILSKAACMSPLLA